MPANNVNWLVHYWAGRYGNLAHLFGPSRSENPFPHLPYVLDNGAFGAWKNGQPWDWRPFLDHVKRYAFQQLRPSWVVVPDVVANRDATLAMCADWAPILRDEYHLDLAIAVQDGMSPCDVDKLVPKADVVFVGGSTAWKWTTFRKWAADYPRVHVGRVNTQSQLERCAEAGIESCDGTGWFRGRPEQIKELGRFLARQAGKYSEAEEREIGRIVYHSRLKHKEQLALPPREAS